VVREGVGAGGEVTQALYAHMNNKTIKIKKFEKKDFALFLDADAWSGGITLLSTTVSQV
jgi:hypothetical protein